jgi:hypothetical protein
VGELIHVPEEWRPVPGYEGRYEVSDHGRVRSLDAYCGNRFGTRTLRKGRMLKLSVVTPSGQRSVQLADGRGNLKAVKVHRLVLLAFRGPPPPDKPFGLHKDDDPANNYLPNLRWGNQSENAYDSVDNGNHVQSRKKQDALGHLLVAPNLVPSTLASGGRGCLACKRTQSARVSDERLRRQGRERTRANRSADGFQRILGESFEDESNRRYAHIMRDHEGGL